MHSNYPKCFQQLWNNKNKKKTKKSVILFKVKLLFLFIWLPVTLTTRGNNRWSVRGWRGKLANVTKRTVNKTSDRDLTCEHPRLRQIPILLAAVFFFPNNEDSNSHDPMLLHNMMRALIERPLPAEVIYCFSNRIKATELHVWAGMIWNKQQNKVLVVSDHTVKCQCQWRWMEFNLQFSQNKPSSIKQGLC